MNARLRPIALIFAVSSTSLLLFECGSKGNCTAQSCPDGCCDSQGACQSGTTNTQCGKSGAMCTNCTMSSQVCTVTGACGTGSTGGGSAGGRAGGMAGAGGGTAGAGGGSAGGAACLQFTAITPSGTYGGYEMTTQAAPYDHYVLGIQWDPAVAGAPAGTTALWLEVWADGNGDFPMVPAMRTFTPANKYATCDVCLGVSTGCDAMGAQCAKDFLSVGGTATVTAYDRNAAAGRVAGNGSVLRFVEWNYQTDAPRSPGQCIDLAGFSMDITWSTATGDGGTDGGTTTDAGTLDAGSGDAGMNDGGEIDGGEIDGGSTDGGEIDGGATDGGPSDGG